MRHLSLILIFLILIAGCTQTGRIINKSEGKYPEPGIITNQTPAENQNHEINTTAAKSISTDVPTEPQSITQPQACPETCDDGNGCTYDYCSAETNYECSHALLLCKDSVRICPDGVRVGCKNICRDNACTNCVPDCSEHKKPVCTLSKSDCGSCQVPDLERCECAQIVSCIDSDNCCPLGCDYTRDSDCEEPKCQESWSCGNWSECSDGTQTRTCADLNSCGTEGLKPTETQPCEEQVFNLTITKVNYIDEWVKISNQGNIPVNMSAWTINDTLSKPRTVFIFPEFILQPGGSVYILKGYGDNNQTHLHRNNSRNIWNNDGDTAVLLDDKNRIISTYSYAS